MSASTHRPLPLGRTAAVVGLVLMLVAAFVLGIYAHDQRLDDADAALEKAAALLAAAESGVADGRAIREFDRHISKAIDGIDRAREAIQDAAAAVD